MLKMLMEIALPKMGELLVMMIVGATNPGSVAQTVHMHGDKIEAPAQVRYKGPRD